MRTLKQTIAKAKKISKDKKLVLFVLSEFEEYNLEKYQIATQCDLDTFWSGINPENILYVIEGGQIANI